MDETVSPYIEFLPERDKYAVFIPMDDVVNKGANVIELLRKVSNSEIEAKRKCIVSILPRLAYRNAYRTLQTEEDLESSGHRAGFLAEWKGAYEIAIEAALANMRHMSQLG